MKRQILSLLFMCMVPCAVVMAQTANPGDQPANTPAPAPKDAVLEHWNAYTNPPNYTQTDPDLFKEYQFQLDTEFSYIEYQEPSVQMREKGPYFGIDGSYDWRPVEVTAWPLNVFHLDSHFDFGDVDYKSPSAVIDNLKDFMMEPRVWLGRDFSPFDFTRLTPYIGLGYRLLYDHLGEVSDIGGYDRLSEYFYAPVGFEIVNDSVQGWEFGFSTEYDIFIQGWQESYLSNVSGSFPDLNNRQTRGFGVRGSFDIVKKMQNLNIVFSPYIIYWNIHQSKTTTAYNNSSGIGFTGYEPANNSTEIGLKIGLQF